MTASTSPNLVHHQGRVGVFLMALVAALALDFFRGDRLGPHLIGLHLIHAALVTLTVGYLWLLSRLRGMDIPQPK